MGLVERCAWCCFLLVLGTVSLISGVRVGSKYQYIPACYRLHSNTYYGGGTYDRCNSPLHITCTHSSNYKICCGPNQHCCQYTFGCCRDDDWDSWDGFEISSVVTGLLAWVGILVVMGTCIGPTVLTKIKKRTRRSKIHPEIKMDVMK